MADMPQRISRDVRMKGFAERTSVGEAIEWLDRFATTSAAESVALGSAMGRILRAPFVAPVASPSQSTAVKDGYALRSCETVGASSYNPLPFCLQACQPALRPFSAELITCGSFLPMGADAVVSFDLVQTEVDSVNLIGSVAQGDGVAVQGQEAQAGSVLIETNRPLRPFDLGLIASFGIKRIPVLRRPKVRILLAGSKQTTKGNLPDSNGPMLRALVARDGGSIEICKYGIADRDAMAEWMSRPGADLVLMCGRTGVGPEDDAPLALTEVGTLSMHGIALHPGGSTGMGSVGSVPVLLLPGSPLDCLCAYDLFAGRLIRRLGGQTPALPYGLRQAKMKRKIVSSVGTVELCRVSLIAGDALPLGRANSGGLVSVAHADGFLLIPAALEGYAPGTMVDVYTYDQTQNVESS